MAILSEAALHPETLTDKSKGHSFLGGAVYILLKGYFEVGLGKKKKKRAFSQGTLL